MNKYKFSDWLHQRDPFTRFIAWYIISVAGSIAALVLVLTFNKPVPMPKPFTWLQWHSPAIILVMAIIIIWLLM